MHWLDTILLIGIGLGTVLGFMSGLFWQLARAAALGLAVFATVYLHTDAVRLLREQVLREAEASVIQGLAYVAVFVAVYLALYLTARVVRVWLRATDLAIPDRLLGAALGAGKVALLGGVACLMLRHSTHPVAQQWLEQAAVAPALARGVEQAITLVPQQLKQSVLVTVRQWQESMTQPTSTATKREENARSR